MKRYASLGAVVAVGLALAAAGCAKRSGGEGASQVGPAPATSSAAPAPTTAAPAPTTPAPPAAEPLAAAGIGPYAVGAKLAALKTSGVLTKLNESTGCPGWATAEGTGVYAGKVAVIFYGGAVNWIEVKSPTLPTMDGAKVGMTLAAVKGIYGSKGMELTDGMGAKAFSVHGKGGLGLFFRTAKDGTVSVIEAGKYETLEFRFTEGEGC